MLKVNELSFKKHLYDSENKNIFFDANYYLKNNSELIEQKIDPLVHYTSIGWKQKKNPSQFFDTSEYLTCFPEIIPIGMNPFEHLHFVLENGKIIETEFANELIEIQHEFTQILPDMQRKRVSIFASFIQDGIIPTHVLFYLAELKKHSDIVIFIADNPISIKEFTKLSEYVDYASFVRHGEYDFGSYKRGIEYLQSKINLENIEELVLCNDSCLAPIVPFDTMFEKMQNSCDFWGLTLGIEFVNHIQSYFMSFSKKVFTSQVFLDFFAKVQKEETRAKVILKYELLFTKMLYEAGFTYNTYIPYPTEDEFKQQNLQHKNLTFYPSYLVAHNSPMIKVNALGDESINYDGLEPTVSLLASKNKELTILALKYVTQKLKAIMQAKQLKTQEENIDDLVYNRLKIEIENYIESLNNSNYKKFPESAIVHKYLDGLNGIEIGASSFNSFGLDKTGGYANVDYSASLGNLWQQGSSEPPAQVNIVAQGDDLPFKDSTLDYVLSSHVIEHFFDPIKAIKEWLRVVKTGGYIVIIVPHKLRTFDRKRPITMPKELIDRHEGKLSPKNYAWLKDKTLFQASIVPEHSLILHDGINIANDYEVVSPLSPDFPTFHWCVWDTESFLALCQSMQLNVVEALDVDDKVGNGFLVIIRK